MNLSLASHQCGLRLAVWRCPHSLWSISDHASLLRWVSACTCMYVCICEAGRCLHSLWSVSDHASLLRWDSACTTCMYAHAKQVCLRSGKLIEVRLRESECMRACMYVCMYEAAYSSFSITQLTWRWIDHCVTSAHIPEAWNHKTHSDNAGTNSWRQDWIFLWFNERTMHMWLFEALLKPFRAHDSFHVVHVFKEGVWRETSACMCVL